MRRISCSDGAGEEILLVDTQGLVPSPQVLSLDRARRVLCRSARFLPQTRATAVVLSWLIRRQSPASCTASHCHRRSEPTFLGQRRTDGDGRVIRQRRQHSGLVRHKAPWTVCFSRRLAFRGLAARHYLASGPALSRWAPCHELSAMKGPKRVAQAVTLAHGVLTQVAALCPGSSRRLGAQGRLVCQGRQSSISTRQARSTPARQRARAHLQQYAQIEKGCCKTSRPIQILGRTGVKRLFVFPSPGQGRGIVAQFYRPSAIQSPPGKRCCYADAGRAPPSEALVPIINF